MLLANIKHVIIETRKTS